MSAKARPTRLFVGRFNEAPRCAPAVKMSSMFKLRFYVAALFVILALGTTASAGTIISFSLKGGGTFGLGSGERSPRFWGAGIRIRELDYGSGAAAILGGRLNFFSGRFLRSANGNYFWGSGGGLTLRGCADLNHNGACDSGDFQGALVTGKFLDGHVVERNGKEFLIAHIVEQLNPQLAAILHLTNASFIGTLGIRMSRLDSNRWWVRNGIEGGDLIGGYGTVPESSSIWLLSASLAGGILARFGFAFGKVALRKNSLKTSSAS